MTEATKKYQQLFLEEAQEHLQSLNTSLLAFEKTPTNPAPVKKMMLAAHTLKGMAASMGYKEIEFLAHQTEDKFENLQKKAKIPSAEMIDEVFKHLDELERLIKQTAPQAQSKFAPTEIFAPVTAVKVSVEKLEALVNLTEELLVGRMRLGQAAEGKNWRELALALNSLDRLVKDLQERVMEARLVPVSQIFDRFPRMVRDLAKEQNKKVNFIITGADIELDRTLINQIGEPLVHLLRNAVDHGISAQGTIKLSARREKSIAIIEVEDDGKGLDWEKLKVKNENLKMKSLEDVLFSGVSTNEEVTKVSGRGVGLRVVKEKVDQVGGTVMVESPVKKESLPSEALVEPGTRFTLKLPLTLAIAQALLIKSAGEKFAIPVADVERLVRVKKKQIKKTADLEAAVIAGEDVPLIRLHQSIKIQEHKNKKTEDLAKEGALLTVLSQINEQTIGFVVDEIIAEQDIIIKPLTGILKDQKGLSGATILGDGSVALILDLRSLVEFG